MFPNSAHVFSMGLDRVGDQEIWEVARTEGFTIVSKDSDFASMSLLLGAPPKVVWIARGNCSAAEVGEILRSGGWAIHGWVNEARTILEAALRSPDPDARDAATRIVHRLGAMHFQAFRELLKAAEAG